MKMELGCLQIGLGYSHYEVLQFADIGNIAESHLRYAFPEMLRESSTYIAFIDVSTRPDVSIIAA
jgi:hypothetical protein